MVAEQHTIRKHGTAGMSNADGYSALKWIKGELDETIRQARQAFEHYAEGGGDLSVLETCGDKLHQIYGTLQMVQLYGAAMLTEEMEQVARAIHGNQVRRKAEAIEALMLSLVQLPDYLEKLHAGGRDMPLVIMPLLNDLRATRDARLLTEASLFTPTLDHGVTPEHVTGSANPHLPAIGKRLRVNYHRGLLGWYRNVESEVALGYIRDVTAELEQHAGTKSVHHLFWVSHALAEGLLDGGIAAGSAVKSLFGRLDREIKRIVDEGETALVRDPDHDLLKSILYYVAGANSVNDCVRSVQDAYQLASALPSDAEVAVGRARLAAPSADVIDTVREVIKADLTQLKDKLDLYIRGDRSQVGELCQLEEPMRKLGDTLGMVGQGALRVRLSRQAEKLAETGKSHLPPDETGLMKIAGELLFVESSLANMGTTHGRTSDEELSEAQAGALLLPQGELGQLVDAALHEAHIDMTKAKDAIIAYLDGPDDPHLLAEAPGNFHNVAGALRILALPDPADMLDGIAGYVQTEVVQPSKVPDREHLNALADAITSVEYYMESLFEGRQDRNDILDVARAAMAKLGLDVNSRPAVPPPEEVSQEPQEAAIAEDVDTMPEAQLETELAVAEAETEIEALELKPVEQLAQEPESMTPFTEEPGSVAPVDEAPMDEIDPEILEVFVEEAEEELGVIQEFVGLWKQNPGDTEARTRLRRSFHTLKGSGRLVGANTIGELAWSIENLLNRVIDETVQATPEILSILDESGVILPRLIEQYTAGGAPVPNVQALAERAFAAADPSRKVVAETSAPDVEPMLDAGFLPEPEPGLVLDEAIEPESEVEPEMDVAQIPSAADVSTEFELESSKERAPDLASALAYQVEPELFGIFREEIGAYLELLEGFVRNCREQLAPLPLDDTVYRALHTIRGSANTAEVPPIADISKSLEKLVEVLRDRHDPADTAVVDLIDEGVETMREQLAAINMPGVPFPQAEGLVSRIKAFRNDRRSAPPAIREPSAEAMIAPDIKAESFSVEELSAQILPRSDPGEGADWQKNTGPASVSAAPEVGYVEVDAEEELVEIFLEEARELLDGLDTALAQWREAPQDKSPVADLQRTLHTLKGGARLAGITPVGDLGHMFESLLTGITGGEMGVTDAVQQLAQQVADRLSSQVDEVSESGRVYEAQDLISQLQLMIAGGPQPTHPAEVGEEVEKAQQSDLQGQLTQTTDKGQPVVVVEDVESEAQESIQEDTGAAADTEPQVLESDERETGSAEVVNLFSADARRETAPGTSDAPVLNATTPQPESGQPVEERSVLRKPTAKAPPAETKLPPKREQVRVRSDVLDRLVNNAGEVSIYRARLEQQNSAIGFNLSELEQTVARLRQQLRQLEMETEAQILFRYEREKEEAGASEEVFDPLELDRFSTMQQVSRSLMETVNDLISIKDLTEDLHRETETLLMQQSRVSTDLQDGLLRTRMVPFTQVISRLQRLVRQTCDSVHKEAELTVSGAAVEVDRSILERMVAPLEHILRNAISHGIETPEKRRVQGKKPKGKITLGLFREGTDVVLIVTDDGQGLKLENIRKQAIEKGLLEEGADIADNDVMQFILEPGFSTAAKVSQIAGRGVGMDVVASEVKQLGGSLEIKSEPGSGSSFIVRLPLTLAISEALLVKMEEDIYAVPHTSIEGVVRVSREELQDCYEGREKGFEYAGHTYLVRYLGSMLGAGSISLSEGKRWFPMLLVRSGDRRVAVQVDGLLGNRQIVVKSVGPQLSSVRWITGGTILGDGRVALILDVNAMVRMDAAKPVAQADAGIGVSTDAAPVRVMVVDDSITVRKVTGRLLERHNFQVLTAKDGVDAVALLQEHVPDLMLLDIEMPRMDGFELARHMQSSPDLKDIPIIMITSRTGEKHRTLAMELGVKGYLGKPYQEMELLENIYSLLAETQT